MRGRFPDCFPGAGAVERRTPRMSEPSKENPESARIVLYQNADGKVTVNVRFARETFWLTQKAMAELFGVKVPAINKHLKNIFESGELRPGAAISKMEMVQSEGGRDVAGEIEFYKTSPRRWTSFGESKPTPGPLTIRRRGRGRRRPANLHLPASRISASRAFSICPRSRS